MTHEQFNEINADYEAGVALSQGNSYILPKKAFRLLERAALAGHWYANKALQNHYTTIAIRNDKKYDSYFTEYAADEAEAAADITKHLVYSRANFISWQVERHIEKELVQSNNPWAGFEKRNPGHRIAFRQLIRRAGAYQRAENKYS